MNKTLILIICILAVLGAGVAIFFASKESPLPQVSDNAQQAPDNTQAIATSSVATATATATMTPAASQIARTIPKGMRAYQSKAYRFSLFYPQELGAEERSEGGGASTITFQNVEKAEGFQIFIVPYSGSQVSEERFKQDNPSGIRESLTNIVVDGAIAAAFYSTNVALGATREVWVVHGGFLYEITTLKPLDTWLDAIIQTWKFTP